MKQQKKMKKISIIIFLASLIISCKSQHSKEDYVGTWQEVQQKNNEFVIVDCGYDGESIKVANDSIFEKGIMEDSNFKIDHVQQDDSGTTLFIDKFEKSYYRFTWINKQKGISKWEIQQNETAKIVRYFVNNLNSKNLRIVKGTKTDCITSEDVGDTVNDSLVIKNENITLLIEDDNCISLESKKGTLLFERCFENCDVKIRHDSSKGIPLTITSGQNSMDINFLKKGNNWFSNLVTYYRSSSSGEEKIVQQIAISLKDFDFNNVAEQFGKTTSKNTVSLNDISNNEKLMQLDIYKIADILKTYPISNQNITIYNDGANNLIEGENFNEARIILLDIVNFSPDRVVAYLNLGDAQWGFDDNENAKKSYRKYISLMKSQGKDLNKIPKRVYERIK